MRTLRLATLILSISSTVLAQQHAVGAPPRGDGSTQGAAVMGTGIAFGGPVGVAGPHPYLDVTAYGAKGVSTDDTAAIQAAITAACATRIGGLGLIPQIYFPPGSYGVRQPQLPSTSAPLIVPCSIEFVGGGGTTPQFETQPVPDISVMPGAAPNAAPLFQVVASGVTFTHLLIDGYNQAVQLKQTGNTRFQDTFLRAQVTGKSDNSPLVEINSLWNFYNGGGLGFSNPNPSTFKNLYDVEFLGEANPSGQITYLQFFTNVTGFGGGFLYDQRTAALNGVPSQFYCSNVSFEDNANSLFTVKSSTHNPIGMSAVSFDHCQNQDPLNATPQAVFNMDQSGGTASGITVNQSGGTVYAIIATNGSVNTYSVSGCNVGCGNQAVDAKGNPLGSGYAQTSGGIDFVSNLNDPFRLVSNFDQLTRAQPDGTAIRVFANDGKFATLGLDGSLGWLFGNGANNGWTAQLLQSTQNTLDVGFSTTLPPTGVTAVPAPGGTLTNGTYYYFVSPAFGGGTCAEAFVGAPSLVSNVARTTTGKNQVKVSWSLPPAASASLTGFCVFRSPSPTYIGEQTAQYVAGSTSTSVTDTGSNFSPSAGSGVEINHMQAFHRFTPTSLGIGTLNPLFNADIRGSIGGATYNTQTNCSSSSSPAACVSAAAGSVTVPASATTEVVNTTAITANSQVLLTFDSSLGAKLGVTCNTSAVQGTISARTAGTSFTIKLPSAPSVNPACFSYEIVN